MAKKQNQTSSMEETLNKSEAFVMKYQKPLLGSLVAILVIIAGIIAVNNYVIKPRAEKASTLLAQGQDYFNKEDFEKALNGDKAEFPGFAVIAEDYSSTDAGNLAKLYAGLCYAQLGKMEDAEKYLEKWSPADDQMVSPAALGALGNVQASLKKVDDAIATLKKAAALADNNSLSPTLFIQAGELLESQGKKAEALKLYTEVKEKYVNSMAYSEIDKYIERVTE